jgi:DNA-binding PadR family transcriptional regulator
MERKLLLLGMLRSNNLYGYQINELIEAHLGSSVNLTKPTAYRYLNQMTEAGWITFSEEQEGNRPTRRVYAITPEGETVFQNVLRESLAHFEPAASHSTISIAFIGALPPEEALTLLQKRRNLIAEMQAKLQLDEAHESGFAYLITHQIRHLNTELEWLDEIIEHIQMQTR